MRSFFVFALVTAVAAACGGSTADIGDATDAGGDGSASGDGASTGDGGGGGDGSLGDGSSSSQFCATIAAYDQKCGLTSACDQAREADCAQRQATLNAAAQQAFIDCASLEPCRADASAGSFRDYQRCIDSKLAPPTSAQEKLATDVCALCAPGSTDCVTSFYRLPGADAGFVTPGPGVDYLPYTDTLIGQIDTQCTMADAGGFGCFNRFTRCADDTVRSAAPPPAACRDR